MGAMGVGELPVEAGLADAGLADHRHDLAVPGLGPLQRLAELIHLAVAADKAGQPPGGRSVKPGAHGPGADELVDLHRLGQALHGQGAERLDLDVAFRQLQRGRAEENAAGLRELLHPGGEMGGLADRRVVHVQIAADGADDHLARVQPDADAGPSRPAPGAPPRRTA